MVVVTSRVGEAGMQGVQSTLAPQLVLGYVSLWHSIRASARNALPYSNSCARRVRGR
jgi:hypothetical protein